MHVFSLNNKNQPPIVQYGVICMKRDRIMTASGINVLAAIWLLLSPFIFGFTGTLLATSSYVVGALVAILALIRMAMPLQAAWMSWANVVLGLWAIAAPFIYGYLAVGMFWNSVITGIVIAAFGIWSASETHTTSARHQRHRA